jgi:hypothetical protein
LIFHKEEKEMAKSETLDWGCFMKGEVVRKEDNKVAEKVLKYGTPIYLATYPTKAVLAASVITGTDEKGQAWNEIFSTVIEIADWLCVGVIMFAGAIWMFGNRSKSLEMLIGASSGYLVIRHAADFQRWLANI